MRAFCHILTCILLAWCAVVPAAVAGDLDDLASAKSLTDAEKHTIRSTVEDEVKKLGSSDVGEVTKARKALSDWSGGIATPVFRGEFSKAACSQLADLVLRAEPIQAVNAIEVLRVIQTYEALQQLAKLANAGNMTNDGVRLAAARALHAAIDAGTDMNSAQADGLVRAITEATKREREWGCSYSQLTALSAIARRNGMDAKVVAAARASQVAGLGAIAAKVGAGNDTQLMKSASRVLAAMIDELATMPAASRTALAPSLEPVLQSLITVGKAPPAGIASDLATAYADTAGDAEMLAELLKPKGRPTGKPPARPAPKKPTS